MAAGSDWQQRAVERGRPVAGWWLIQYSRLLGLTGSRELWREVDLWLAGGSSSTPGLFLYRFRPFSSRLRWIARSWSLLLLASGRPPLTSDSSSAIASSLRCSGHQVQKLV